jgi:hypothetical protein
MFDQRFQDAIEALESLEKKGVDVSCKLARLFLRPAARNGDSKSAALAAALFKDLEKVDVETEPLSQECKEQFDAVVRSLKEFL